jgi:integrase
MSELLSLKWSDVDLERRTARLHGIGGGVTKNGDAWRDIPLSSNAVRLLQGLDRNSNFVLPISQNALQIAWGRSMKAARKKHLLARLCQELSQQGFSEDIQAREVRALVFKKRKPLPESVEAFTRLEAEDKTLVDLHFHDLRHEATSRLADKLQMHELMKVTGHKTSRMVSRYYHPRAEDLAKKLD